MSSPVRELANNTCKVVSARLRVGPPTVFIREVPDETVEGPDLALLHGKRFPPAVEVQLQRTQVCPMPCKPCQGPHPRPVQDLVSMTLTPTHLSHCLVPWHHIPPVLVVDVDHLAAKGHQPLRGRKVMGPDCLKKTPLWSNASRAAMPEIMQTQRHADIKQCLVSLAQDQPNSLSEAITVACGASEPIHGLDDGSLIGPLVLCVFLCLVRHICGVVVESVDERLVTGPLAQLPPATDAQRLSSLHCDFDIKGHDRLVRAVGIVVHNDLVLTSRCVAGPHNVLYRSSRIGVGSVHIYIQLATTC
mmetsp:Transcript_130571/g.325793  ORF Transcript_130571/g.325793 Transcript_130571/m.325793 type:complete len:303 (+) Transcript_130571:735-1643(+)